LSFFFPGKKEGFLSVLPGVGEMHRERKRKSNKAMRIGTYHIDFRFLSLVFKRRDWFSSGVPGLDRNQMMNHGEHREHGEIKKQENKPGLDFP
jgi:hypothetical protein